MLKQKYLSFLLVFICILSICKVPYLLAQNEYSISEFSYSPLTIDPETEVENPLKGFHMWNDVPFLNAKPIYDVYMRFSWRDLETQKGQYNFVDIDQYLDALEEGQRFAFRIMPMNTCCTNFKDGADLPDYVVNEGRGFFYPYHSLNGSDSIFVPDWNDTALIGYMENFIQALGEKYNGDPRIGWIDISFYGNWSEWHTYPVQYPDSAGNYNAPPPNSTFIYAPAIKDPSDTTRQKFRDGSIETKFRLLHSQIDAFSNTQLVLSTADLPALFEALETNTSIPIGIRRDSWGDIYFNDITKWNNYVPSIGEWELFNNRWKTAPFVIESFGDAFAGINEMLDQVDSFHVATIGFGNMGAWNSLPDYKKETYLRCGRRSGYRYQISNVTAQLNNIDLQLQFEWKNSGIAPTYDDWKVHLFAINPKSEILISSIVETPIDLNSLFDGSSLPVYTNHFLTFNAGWEDDTIEIRIKVIDTNNYLKPLNLDLVNGNTDGSYPILTIINQAIVDVHETLEFPETLIFPNPVSDELTIYWPGSTVEKAEFTDISGKTFTIHPTEANGDYYKIDLRQFEKGIYIISLYGNNGNPVLNHRLLIQ